MCVFIYGFLTPLVPLLSTTRGAPTYCPLEIDPGDSHYAQSKQIKRQPTTDCRDQNNATPPPPQHEPSAVTCPLWFVQDKRFRLRPTAAFSVICSDGGWRQCGSPDSRDISKQVVLDKATTDGGGDGDGGEAGVVCIDVICPYTRGLVVEGFARRRGVWRVTADR